MIRKFFRGIWATLNFIRRLILNGIVLAILVVIGVGIWQSFQPLVKQQAVLVIEPSGQLVEQWDGDAVDMALAQALGEARPQTRVFDVISSLEHAASDDNIRGVVLKTDGLWGGSPAQLQDIAQAVAVFKASGKPVYSYGTRYSQAQYYLAAQAQQVYMDPLGDVLLEGFAIYRNYYAEAAERLKASVNVFRVGDYKSAVEPWLRNNMSPLVKESNQALLSSLWQSWRDSISAVRDLEPMRVESYAQDYAQLLAASRGDGALTAQAVGLVDVMATPDEFKQAMIDVFGREQQAELPDFPQLDMWTYLLDIQRQTFQKQAIDPKKAVAVVAIEGALMEGAVGSGYVDIEAVVQQLDEAARDTNVSAIVVRVNSPGGTVTAAETLRRAIARVKEQGKPVVVSMAGVAASGGYWLATAADRIWAQTDTLTGSIGIYGVIPTFEKSLATVGVYSDGVATSPYAGAFRVDRELNTDVKQSIQLYIESGYARFLNVVAEAREMTLPEVERAAGGRVWSGAAAKSLGLVDELGGLDASIKGAAQLAGLADYRVLMLEAELGWFEGAFISLGGAAVKHLPESLGHKQALLRLTQPTQAAAVLGAALALKDKFWLPLIEKIQRQNYQLTPADVTYAWWGAELQ